MPWRLARSSTKKRVWVGWPPRLTWKASMTLAKPSRTVASTSCAASSSPRLRDRRVQELAPGRRALPVLDLQVLAEVGHVRNR
jgi:hypothetical protein